MSQPYPGPRVLVSLCRFPRVFENVYCWRVKRPLARLTGPQAVGTPVALSWPLAAQALWLRLAVLCAALHGPPTTFSRTRSHLTSTVPAWVWHLEEAAEVQLHSPLHTHPHPTASLEPSSLSSGKGLPPPTHNPLALTHQVCQPHTHMQRLMRQRGAHKSLERLAPHTALHPSCHRQSPTESAGWALTVV